MLLTLCISTPDQIKYFKIKKFSVPPLPLEQYTFLQLVKACKEWKVQYLILSTMHADIN